MIQYIECVIFFKRVHFIFLGFFFARTDAAKSSWFSFIIVQWSLGLVNMSGIQNIEGGQHCYVNALLQCFSLNDVLFTALEKHNIGHIYGKR